MPGTSGVLSPFGEIDGLYFNDSREPDDFMYEFKKDIKNILDADGVEYIEIHAEDKKDYYRILDKLSEFNKECITVSGTSKDNLTVILENQEDSDDSSDEEELEDTIDIEEDSSDE